MKDRVFCDSNIFIYALSRDEKEKRSQVNNFLKKVASQAEIVISTQVLSEVTNIIIKKKLLAESVIPSYLDLLAEYNVSNVVLSTIKKAIIIKYTYQLSFYDSLIISSAVENNCNILYTEDLNDGQVIEGLKIINPFKA